MAKHFKNQQTQDYIHSESFSDEATDKKIDKHLSDINDVISDEDIRNVKVDIGTNDASDAGEAEKSVMENEDTRDISLEDHTKEEEEGQKVTTPWNILGE